MSKIEIPIEIFEIPDLLVESEEETEDTNEIPDNSYQETNPGCHLLVEATINNEQKIVLIIDTGASKSVFDTELLTQFTTNIETPTNIESAGVNSAIDIHFGQIPNIQFGSLMVNNFDVGLTDLSHVNAMYKKILDKEIWGLLGGDFLFKYKAIIDYSEGKMTVEDDIIN